MGQRGPLDTEIGELLLAIHEASHAHSAERFRQWAMRELRRYLDFDFAIWGAGDGVARNIHTVSILDQTPQLFETWEPVKHEDQFAHLVIGNTGRTWTLSDLPGAVRDSRAYNEHWRLYHARQMLSTMEIDAQSGLHVFLTLCREHHRADFSSQDRQLKGLITRHLFLAARHNSHLQLCRHNDAGAMAMVDRFGRIHNCGFAFADMVAEEWSAAARRQLPIRPHMFPNGRYDGRALSVSFMPLDDRFIARAAPLGLHHKLTAREREIAAHYAGGNSYKQVARLLGISPWTVRNHLQAIYEKLGISDKAELASRLAAENKSILLQ